MTVLGTLSLVFLLVSEASVLCGGGIHVQQSQQTQLTFPGLLKRDELLAGNPLATYAAMLELDKQYRESQVFAGIYPEVRCNFEQFLGDPLAGRRAMSLPALRSGGSSSPQPLPENFEPQNALKVVLERAKETRLVVWGEEHHLSQTRSLYEDLVRGLWSQGYRYLAAETFADNVMEEGFERPDYSSGYYLMDPVFANAVRVAKKLGYTLVAYDTKERGPDGDASYRDRTQAENIYARVFKRDPRAKVLVLAGRGHASEVVASDGWTPMAQVLKRLSGIDPLTIYAPTMSERTTPEEENPYYRTATAKGHIKSPTIYVDREGGGLFGTSSFDAYVFWPRTQIVDGRPDWMTKTLGRRAVRVPGDLQKGSGLRLVQAFVDGDPPTAVPMDQLLLEGPDDTKSLMLPPGSFTLRTIDRDGKILANGHLRVSN